MNIIRYIQGIRKGREINRLEREAMKDPFLADALEGYDKVRGNHEVRIKKMQDKISAQTRQVNHTPYYWAIAAGILLVIGIGGGYFLWDRFNQPETMLVAESISKPLDTTASENLQEKTIIDSLVADYSPKKSSDIQDKQAKTVIIQDEKMQNKPEMEMQSETVADLKEYSPAAAALAESKTLKTDTIITPRPVIGMKAYNEYLKANLVRPTDEECKDVTGTVTLSFSIDRNGRPYNIRIIQSLCPLADWEAMRLVKKGPLWTVSESIATVNVYF